jgi:ribosome-binding protein aMBF1 (putative translation factor)
VNREAIGHRIRVARIDRKWSQEELAQRMAVDVSTLSAIENGKRCMRLSTAETLSSLFGWSLDYLACRPEPTSPTTNHNTEVER